MFLFKVLQFFQLFEKRRVYECKRTKVNKNGRILSGFSKFPTAFCNEVTSDYLYCDKINSVINEVADVPTD